MAYAYIGQNNLDAARDILEKGYELTQDSDLKAKLDEIASGNITDYAGNVRKMSCYGADGNLIYYHIFTYDEQNRKSSVTSFDGNGNQTGHVDLSSGEDSAIQVSYSTYTSSGEVMKIEEEFDADGHCIRETHYSLDGELGWYYTYAYDLQDHKTREEHYGEDGELKSYIIYDYDENGHETQRASFEADGDMGWRYTYAYDAQGHKIREEKYDPTTGKLGYYWIYAYDAQGHRTREEHYDADGELDYYFIIVPNEKGRSTEVCEYDADGTLKWRQVNRYDDDGKPISSDEYDGAGNLTGSTVYD